jgi:intein/homing endonuclease
MVSFSLIAKKHIEYIKRHKLAEVQELDELGITSYTPHLKYTLILHPFIYIYHKLLQNKLNSLTEDLRDKLSIYMDWWRSHYEQLIAVDVCDSDRLSELAVELLNDADKVIVPSNFCVEVCKCSGVRKPVYRVQHGLDPEWYSMPNQWETSPVKTINPALMELYLYKIRRNKKLILFWLWHSPDRKGWPEAKQLYEKLIRERKDVVLVLKTVNPNSVQFQEVMHLGAVQVYGWLSEYEKMCLYDLSDLTLMFSRGGGFEINCTPPDTLVVTDKGVVPIKDVREGDYVLTHNGRFEKVTKVFKRHYKGKLIVIKPYGFENIAIKLTPEHPVLILPTSRYKQRKWNYILKEKPIWVRAGEVAKGDVVLIPILAVENAEIVYDLAKYTEDDIKLNEVVDKVNVTNEYIEYVASGTSRRDTPGEYRIMEILGETKKVVERAIKYYGEGKEPKSERVKRVIEFLKEINYEPQKVRVKRFVKLDKYLARVIGYYLAEGSINESNYAVEFSFGNEPEIVNDCVDCIAKTFGYYPSVRRYEDKNITKVIVCNKAIARFLLSLCGKGARNKRFSLDLFRAGKEVLSEAVWAMILGDGCIQKERIVYATTSPHMAYFMFLALASLGYKPRMQYHKRLKEYYIYMALPKEIRTVNVEKKPYPNILAPREADYRLHSNKLYISPDRKYLIALVKEVSAEDYDEEVYNLEVEDDNTYTAHMIIVHNCLESLARGIPCVASYWGSWRDYLPPFLGVKTGERVQPLPGNAIHVGYGYKVDVESALNKVHDILDNIEEYRAKLKEYKLKLSEEYCWDNVAERLVKVLEGGVM